VVDVHHKPRGLTSLSRCHLSQVHKVQHKPRKKFSWGLKLIWSKTWECAAKWRTGQCSVHLAYDQVNRPLSGFFWGRSAIIHRTVRCAPDMSDEPTEQRLSGANGRLQKWTFVNSAQQKSECTGHVRCGTGLSGVATGQGFQRSTRSKPQRACWRGTH
jgi:hypothetical protein